MVGIVLVLCFGSPMCICSYSTATLVFVQLFHVHVHVCVHVSFLNMPFAFAGLIIPCQDSTTPV